MEKIDEQLYNLGAVEIPNDLHQSVMRRVNYQKIKPALFIAFFLFLLNFIIIAWHINAKLIDTEFIDMTRDFLDVFSFNFSFIKIIVGNFFEIISPMIFLSAVLSLAGAVYIGEKISLYHRFGKA